MQNQQVQIVSIHDEEPDRRVLAVDLKHILSAIAAIDSSYFEVYAKDSAITETIRGAFSHVVDRDPSDYFE